MPKKLKEKEPDVTGRKLIKYGYRYKLKELTREERKAQREGIKEYDAKAQKWRIYEPPDLNYYYRIIGDVTVKIFKVGDKFFYKNVWLKYMHLLPQLEEKAKEDKVYDDLDKLVQDTKVLPDTIPDLDNIPLGSEYITLSGGPMDGRRILWKTTLPMYMGQYENPDTGKTSAARYKRTSNKAVYEYMDNL